MAQDHCSVAVYVHAQGTAEHLGLCLEALQAQTIDDVRVAVALEADASVAAREAAEQAAARDGRISVVDASFVSAGEPPDADFTMHLHGNEFLAPDCLSRLVALAQASGASAVAGRTMAMPAAEIADDDYPLLVRTALPTTGTPPTPTAHDDAAFCYRIS